MGIVYKLSPEIKNYILEEKKANPGLSCRGLIAWIDNKFQLKLSKSTINSIIKEAGLSMPVGRRPKKKKRRIEFPNLPMLEVKAEEATLKAEAEKKAQEEALLKADEEKKAQEEALRKAEEERRLQEEAAHKAELERWSRLAEEERAKAEAEKKTQEEALRKAEEERKAQEEAAARKAEENIEAREEALRKAEEERRLQEEAIHRAEEERAVQEALRKAEEERRAAEAEFPLEREICGAVLLRAADSLLGGSYYIIQAIKNRISLKEEEIIPKIESLIYLPLFEEDLASLWSLIGKRYSLESPSAFLNELQSINALPSDFLRIISTNLQEIRCIKVTLSDKNFFYFDGQMHTVWSTQFVPYGFSVSAYAIKNYVNKYFYAGSPLVLFTAPGYDTPTRDFFNLLLSLEAKDKSISQLTFYNNKFEEQEGFSLTQGRKYFYIFGLWPWQFIEYRKVKSMGEFKPYHCQAQNRDFCLAPIEIELTQPNTKELISLKGCALKTSLNEKTRLLILSNFPSEGTGPEEPLELYLNHWPNLEEGFQDFSRKIELSTYTANSQRFFSTQELNLSQLPAQELKVLLKAYLETLDLYIRLHFLPSDYENLGLSSTKERFYSLKVELKQQENRTLAIFKPPQGHPFLKDLEYLCRRMNEREIVFANGSRLWLGVSV